MLEGSRSQLGMLIGAGPGLPRPGPAPLWRRPSSRLSGHYESPVSSSRPVGGRMAMPTLGASDPFSDLSWTTTSMVLPLRSPLTGAPMRNTSSPSCSTTWSSSLGSPAAKPIWISSVARLISTGSRRRTVPSGVSWAPMRALASSVTVIKQSPFSRVRKETPARYLAGVSEQKLTLRCDLPYADRLLDLLGQRLLLRIVAVDRADVSLVVPAGVLPS